MAAMDTVGCNVCGLSIGKVTALVLFVLVVFGRIVSCADSGKLCYSCTNVPHPRDCGRIQKCGPSEECFVESFVTPSGSTVFNMGCASQLKCSNAALTVGRRESLSTGVQKREGPGITICIECCADRSYCNRQLCDTKANLTGNLCMQCDDVLIPKDCATVTLCADGEICYTETKIIHGETRYRLGCVKETACQMPASVETVTTFSPLLDYCGICCKRGIENCNLELCDQRGGSQPTDVVQMYLIEPPVDLNGIYCHDEAETGCILLGADRPGFCDNPSIKNHVCPKFCGTCVASVTSAPGKPTIAATESQPSTTTTHDAIHTTKLHATHTTHVTSSTQKPFTKSTTTSTTMPTRDCFFESSVYLGHVSKTIDNITCDRWDVHYLPNDPLVSKFPDLRLEDATNYCRDPDDKGHPWCYVKGNPVKSWEFCDVPYCQECYYKNQSHGYNGYVTSTNNGECLDWTGWRFPDSFFPDGNVTNAKNYCRDPDRTGYPYCLTRSGLLPCTIPQCKATCEDDPSTKCEDLKLIFCQSDHFAKLFCPKTCEKCGFGLLEPVHINPPEHKVCADDPSAKCDQIRELICADLSKAAQFCPSTCNLCGVNITNIVTRMTSTTTTVSTLPPTTPPDICVDSPNMKCNNTDITDLICSDPPAASNFCRKTCNLCDRPILPLALDACGDPIKEPMCKFLHNEVCLCYDTPIASILCLHYCNDQCEPFNKSASCPTPKTPLVGRR